MTDDGKPGRAPDASELRAELRHFRRTRSVDRRPGAWIAPLAALLLVRWAEHAGALAPRHRWTVWKDLPEAKFIAFLRGELVPALNAMGESAAEPLGHRWRHLAAVLDGWVAEWPEEVPTVLGWCNAADFGDERGRRRAGETLAIVADPVGGVGGEPMSECTTPQAVADLMVELLNPRPGERIYDPCFGGGTLLTTVAYRLRRETAQASPPGASSLFGVEIEPHAYCVGLARVVLAGMGDAQLELGDALERTWAEDEAAGGFDGILAVPPWGRGVRRDAWADPQFAASTFETLFLQHVMTSLRPDGRGVIALPDAALYRGGADKRVRKHLLTSYRVDGVVSLPEGAFRPFTNIKTSLLVFRRREAAESVRFLRVANWSGEAAFVDSRNGRPNRTARAIANRFALGVTNGGRSLGALWEMPVGELAERNHELVAKRTGARALRRTLQSLRRESNGSPGEVRLRPLGDVADVFAGRVYGAGATGKRGRGSAAGPRLLSGADVRRSPTDPEPTRSLPADRGATVRPECRLQPWDLLLATMGKVGTVGLVLPDGAAVDAVAGPGLAVVRPGGEMDAEFLLGLLRSPEYQRWLEGHARGVGVQHLPIQRLRSLPLPVPTIDFQRHIREQRLVFGLDRQGLLRTMGHWSERSYDPVEMWFQALKHEVPGRSDTSATRLELLERLSRSFFAALARREEALGERDGGVGGDGDGDGDDGYWEVREPMSRLLDIGSVPPGAGRLAILESVGFSIKMMELKHPWIDDDLTTQAIHAWELARTVSPLLEAERESILGPTPLDFEIDRDAIRGGADTEIQLRVGNASPVGIRNVEISSAPAVASRSVPYLAPGEELSLPVALPPETPQGLYRFWLDWTADRLDGKSVRGEKEMSVLVDAVGETPRPVDFGTSPYVVANPVTGDMFYGREGIIDEIRRQLPTERQANVVLLQGNRRTGKTSILTRLGEPRVLPGWLPVYCDLQGALARGGKPGLETANLFHFLARRVGRAAHAAGLPLRVPGADRPDGNMRFDNAFRLALSSCFSDSPLGGFDLFQLFLRDILSAARPRRLLLMVDEFDKLIESIEQGVTSPDVPGNLRSLLHEHDDLSAVLAGSHRFKRMREDYWSALFGLGHTVPVGKLREEAARELVTKPVEGRLVYGPEARDRVVELCARRPNLIQHLCTAVFRDAADHARRTVAVEDVERAAMTLVGDNQHLRTLWERYAGTERRRFILALCQHLANGLDPVTLELLELKFREHGLRIPSAVVLTSDLDHLLELELLQLRHTERGRGAAYDLATPLMGEWIRRNVDFEAQKRRAADEIGDADE